MNKIIVFIHSSSHAGDQALPVLLKIIASLWIIVTGKMRQFEMLPKRIKNLFGELFFY
jgi:hypothetical protein